MNAADDRLGAVERAARADFDFSILLPTRGRPGRLLRLLDSIALTARDPARIEVVLYVDEDDAASQAVTHAGVALVKLISPAVRPMGRMMCACYEESRGRYLFLMNDDAVFRTRGWDAIVKDTFDRFPDGVALVYGNDLDQRQRLPTFPILSRTTCEVLGEVCPTGYRNLHIESHLHDIFRQLALYGHERRVYLDNVVFEHEHPQVGKAAVDPTYLRRRDLAADEQLYFELTEQRRHMAWRLKQHIEAKQTGERLSGQAVGKVTLVGRAGSRNWNRALGGLTTEYVAFLPDGAEPTPGWLSALQRVLDADAAVAVAGVKILHRRNHRILHAGIGFVEVSGRLRFSHLYHGLDPGHPAVNRQRELQAVAPVGMMARSSVVASLGGFDEGLEDGTLAGIDLCLRVRHGGKKVVYAPDALIYCDGPLRAGADPAPARRFTARWEDSVTLDLERLLKEDGFQLEERAGVFVARSLGPS